MKYLITFIALLLTSVAFSQVIDNNAGYLDLRIDAEFEPVKEMFEPVTQTDESGRVYHVLKDPAHSEYKVIFGAKVAKVLVYEEKGIMEEIVIIYASKTKRSAVTEEAVSFYGGAECITAVQKPEMGGCVWRGEKYTLWITHEEHPYVEARFSRVKE